MTDLPPPVIALQVACDAIGRWVGHTPIEGVTRSPFGEVRVMMSRVVASEYVAGIDPEIGCVFTWLLLPRQPVRCVSAVAYRAAHLMHAAQGSGQLYSDSIDLMPATAWALCLSDDPIEWYVAIKEGA